MKKLLLLFLVIFSIYVVPCLGDPFVQPYTDISTKGHVEGAQTEDSFWDLPHYFQAITIASAILVLGWKILTLLLARMRRTSSNENRDKILDFIEQNPGSTVNYIKQKTEFKRGTVRYHIKILKDEGKVLLIKNGSFISIFRNDLAFLNDEKRRSIEPHLYKNTCKEVCRQIFKNPGITTTELAEELDVHKSTILFHVRTLKEMDCLDIKNNGVRKHYYLKDECHPDNLPFFERIK